MGPLEVDAEVPGHREDVGGGEGAGHHGARARHRRQAPVPAPAPAGGLLGDDRGRLRLLLSLGHAPSPLVTPRILGACESLDRSAPLPRLALPVTGCAPRCIGSRFSRSDERSSRETSRDAARAAPVDTPRGGGGKRSGERWRSGSLSRRVGSRGYAPPTALPAGMWTRAAAARPPGARAPTPRGTCTARVRPDAARAPRAPGVGAQGTARPRRPAHRRPATLPRRHRRASAPGLERHGAPHPRTDRARPPGPRPRPRREDP